MNKNVWEITNKLSAAVAHEHNEAKYQLNSVVALEFSGDYTGEGFICTYDMWTIFLCQTYFTSSIELVDTRTRGY